MTYAERREGSDHDSAMIVVDQFLPHPPATVWRALIDPVKLAAWFMPNDFAPVIGRRFTFHRNAKPDVRFSDTVACQVLELRDPELLAYSWTDGGQYAGDLDSIVTWTLHPEGHGTRLLLEHRGFRRDDPMHQAARRLMSSGWTYLAHRLDAFITSSASTPAPTFMKGPTMTTTIPAADYTATLPIASAPEPVFDALTTLSGLAAWWAPVTGSGAEGGELRFDMNVTEGPLVIAVHTAQRPTIVVWDVLACPFLPDWAGTTIAFDLGHSEDGQCDLFFRHHGLTGQFDCYDMCRQGWDHFLPSLRDYAATGTGSPLGSPADNARRR